MLGSCVVAAPAKVNIGLKVLPGAAGGYHNIESVFQAISLFDTLEVEALGEGEGCAVSCTGADLPPENTLTGAYRSFCRETGLSRGVRVKVTKRIPLCSGLGGGSSDAAALVFALERLFGLTLGPRGRARVAERVGSDVFFFLLGGGCAVVTGRGQHVRPIPARGDLFFVPVFPGAGMSTGEAYGLVDQTFAQGYAPVGPALPELEALYHGPVEDWGFVNTFTAPVSARLPAVAQALGDLHNAGAVFADLSGSGSAVFGVFVSQDQARRAACRLSARWERCCVATCVCSGPLPEQAFLTEPSRRPQEEDWYADYGDKDSQGLGGGQVKSLCNGNIR
ncbi:MAG: 4-(cytidine 5'-diphospho)-2-C-methyl-D-erythritol kinase [Spirochaetaceae bacterium]|jgi:4-diphosphocytidyl-2-C-methyl-D-erythritol kinase|nr:4-(cytidine 5'-diphospho)-2-C-methyl-D-erythritol kinase [Spirochaetaceae bacterium]